MNWKLVGLAILGGLAAKKHCPRKIKTTYLHWNMMNMKKRQPPLKLIAEVKKKNYTKSG